MNMTYKDKLLQLLDAIDDVQNDANCEYHGDLDLLLLEMSKQINDEYDKY